MHKDVVLSDAPTVDPAPVKKDVEDGSSSSTARPTEKSLSEKSP
jgi:hypothetical protein